MTESSSESDYGSSKTGWQQVRHYNDHLGLLVALEQYFESDWEPDASDLVPIQTYSLVPLDHDHEQLQHYLLQTSWNDEKIPLFEIYSYCPMDAFDCIEHNRREVAYRKGQSRSGASDAPPLIPLFFHAFRGKRPLGRVILLRSHSYRLGGEIEDSSYAEAGQGPDFLDFTRSFSSTRPGVDVSQRKVSGFWSEEVLYSEAFELSVSRETDQKEIHQHVVSDVFYHASNVDACLQFAVDTDEVRPPDPVPVLAETIRQQLDQQFNEFTLDKDACLFAAALLTHLPAPKTLNLIFIIPDTGPSIWSGIRPAHIKALSQQPSDYKVGVLHTLSAGIDQEEPPAPHRVFPQLREDPIGTAIVMLRRPVRMFAVVLDRANFVSEAGVYFFLSDWDGLPATAAGSARARDKPDVWRSIGMPEVARRLAMLAVEESTSN
ncbi:hypothetical protein BDW74DRAFT_180477 [Aspergillus multicolor]|uniref:uncharacterized protein n=1 Tax=Aspergillus multicolor TaxID=41759 RepID=UPI003CCCE684